MSLLTVRNLSLAYGAHQVLGDVSLGEIGAAAVVGVLGPNGAGKSTFLRALSGLEPFEGEVLLGNEPVTRMGHTRRAGRVGYLPQSLPQGTSLVAYEAVVSACRAVRPGLTRVAIDEAVEQVFDMLAIRDLAFRPLNRMSGGQRQMVGLAQVVVGQPQLLLLDEPTSALDLRWQMLVFRVVRRLLERTGGACLVALHDINLAMRHCDAIALFAEGRLLAFGAPNDAMTSRTLSEAYQVTGRVETSASGVPFVTVDNIFEAGDPSRVTPNLGGHPIA